jgi:hypothetical protein
MALTRYLVVQSQLFILQKMQYKCVFRYRQFIVKLIKKIKLLIVITYE